MKNRIIAVRVIDRGDNVKEPHEVVVFSSFKTFWRDRMPEWSYVDYMRESKITNELKSEAKSNYIRTIWDFEGESVKLGWELYMYRFIK